MRLEEALARADRLCPPNHPSGKLVLYTVDTRKRRPLADRDQQLESADALGVLAAEVRRLEAKLSRVELLLPEWARAAGPANSFDEAADELDQALRGPA